MGRHSSPNQWPFYRSVFSWFVPWALVAAIVGIGLWIAVDALSGGAPNSKPSAALAAGRHTPSPSRTAGKVKRSHTPRPMKTHSPAPITTHTPSPRPKKQPKAPLITNGITVQVLNGTSDPTAAQRMADRLATLGFQIIAVGGSSRAYPRTTVFWAYPSAEPAAKALAAHFGWVVAPKPDNLSAQVAVHVVVGADGL
ncbi:MAG: LytR C-terminal domain-containing protein [Actinomycetota bacterium]|nr:LytR C-terminal domain-containing protein [Actinomycetota bacterium]